MNLPRRLVERALFWVAVAGFVVAAAMAWAGAGELLDATGGASAWHDQLYLAVQAFLFQIPAGQALPWTLDVARILGPVVLGYAALRTLALLFQDVIDEQVRTRWAGRKGDATVICGLGWIGGAVLREFRPVPDEVAGDRPMRQRVIAVEDDRTRGDVDEARRRGAPVVFGDATDARTWRRARLRRAEHVLIACGDDRTNGEAAEVARALAEAQERSRIPWRRPRRPLRIEVHLDRPELVRRHRERLAPGGPAGRIDVETFNTSEHSAGRLVAKHPPFAPGPAGVDRVVVIGSDRLAEAVIVRVGHIWSTGRGKRGDPLPLAIAGPGASRLIERLRQRFADTDDVFAFEPYEGDIEGVAAAARLFREQWAARVYVCLAEEADAIAVGLRLDDVVTERYGAGRRLPIVVRTGHDRGLAGLVLGAPDGPGGQHLAPVSPFDLSCDRLSLFGADEERLARMAHEAYQGLMSADPASDAPGSRTGEDWDRLDDSTRAANRAQVRTMRSHYALVGIPADGERASLLPLRTLRVPLQVDTAEIEELAKVEHLRWWRRKEADGWTHGPKDDEKKTNPNMVAWDALPEEEREKDRAALLAYLGGLALLGFRLPRRDHQGELGGPGWESRAVAP